MSEDPTAGAMNAADRLDAHALMTAATAEARLDDFGGDKFVEPLTRFLAALVSEAHLNAAGVAGREAQVKGALVNRLRFQDSLRRHPEILDEELAPPILIMGLARTGTTKLQRMMSADLGNQKLAFWRMLNPAPFPGVEAGDPDPRIAITQSYIDLLAQYAPDFMAAHPTQADEADEDAQLMALSFESLMNALPPRVPSYLAWLLDRSPRPAYDYLYRHLQYLQWQDGGGRGRPWVLKSPAHMGNLELVTQLFPGVTVVFTHRDVRVALASLCRLMEINRRMESDEVDLVELGHQTLSVWSGEVEKHLLQREQVSGTVDIVDVPYSEIRDDPMTVVRAVYEASGRVLDSAAADCMAQWDRGHPQHQFGRHAYSLESYGLTTEEVEMAFQAYVDRFGSATE